MKNPKNILITGASSGIGQALAELYAQPGIFLAITGRDEERLNKAAEILREKGAEVEAALIDVADRGTMESWMKEIDRDHPLDLVIANAGISGGSGGYDHAEPVAQARKIFDVNLNGVLNTIEPVLDEMIRRGRGQIAIMSSLAAYRGWPGAPAYSASKGAVRFYGEALRGALKETGVQVNVICPGFIVSRMTAVNEFPMPFLMPTEKAAKLITRKLKQDQSRISFPMPTLAISWFISAIPDILAQKILTRLPEKSR